MEILKHTLVFSKPNLMVTILLSIRKNALATYRRGWEPVIEENCRGKNSQWQKPVYYGLAIRRNSDSADKVRDAIWASYYHYSSEDPDTWYT